MQQHKSLLELWESINQASLELIKNVGESNKSAFESVFNGQSSLIGWGKLTKSALDATKTITDFNTSVFNNALRNELGVNELDTLADSVEELGGIVGSLVKTLTEVQVATFSNVVASYAQTLRSLKGVVSADELVAVQMKLQSELQEKLKSSALETLQTFGELNSALTDWVASSAEKLSGDIDES